LRIILSAAKDLLAVNIALKSGFLASIGMTGSR